MIEYSDFIIVAISALIVGFCVGYMIALSVTDGREEALLEECKDLNMFIVRISKRLDEINKYNNTKVVENDGNDRKNRT